MNKKITTAEIRKNKILMNYNDEYFYEIIFSGDRKDYFNRIWQNKKRTNFVNFQKLVEATKKAINNTEYQIKKCNNEIVEIQNKKIRIIYYFKAKQLKKRIKLYSKQENILKQELSKLENKKVITIGTKYKDVVELLESLHFKAVNVDTYIRIEK